MRGHDDEPELVLIGNTGDLSGCFPGFDEAWTLRQWKLVGKKRVESLAAGQAMVFSNLGGRPELELEAVIAGDIHHMEQRHSGAEY